MKSTRAVLVFVIPFLVGLLAASTLEAGAAVQQVPAQSAQIRDERIPQVTVTGTAAIDLPADFVTIDVMVVTLDPEIEKSLASNDSQVKAVLRFLQASGIALRDLSTDYMALDPKEERGYGGASVFKGYEARKGITFVLRDLSKYEAVLTGVLKAGANRLDEVTFGSDRELTTRKEARTKAIQAAREKATTLATQLGQSVGDPITIVEDARVQQVIRSRMSQSLDGANVRDSYVVNLETVPGVVVPGAIRVVASVTVTFRMSR